MLQKLLRFLTILDTIVDRYLKRIQDTNKLVCEKEDIYDLTWENIEKVLPQPLWVLLKDKSLNFFFHLIFQHKM